jgi:uncharacterized membrane protein YphA (DoxX/SURF4 family)
MAIARSFGIVLLGVVAWGIAWTLGGLALRGLRPDAFVEGAAITDPLVLGALLLWSVVLSVAVGALAMALGRSPRLVLVLAGVQLLIGIAVQSGSWALFPLLYHLVFLGAVVPATWAGGALLRRRATAPS